MFSEQVAVLVEGQVVGLGEDLEVGVVLHQGQHALGDLDDADVGGVGDRYTCMIQGKERELWFEDGRWFVAAKVATKQTPPSNA